MGSYKDSGIEWIGEIPKGWEVNKYKFLGSTKNGLTYTPEDITTESDGILVLRSGNIQNGQLDFNDVVFVNTSIPNNLKLQKNDILITARNGSANLVGKNILINTEINATYGAFMMVFRANRRINPRFAQYTMNPTFDNYKTFFTTSTVNQLTANIFYNMAVPLPPLQEQAAIADFLDKRNAEIDAITAKITQQIQTLKDYRQSLITETVTKGLDKTVSYKDSGIEWIGEIPNDWDVNKIKYTSTLHGRIGWQGLTSEEYIDEGPYLITGTDFQNGEIDWDSCVHISEERWAQADKIQIKDGDLLITKDGTVGKTAIVTNMNNKASLNSGVLLINLQTHSKKYLYWLLNSKVFWEWFEITNSGNSTILHLYQKDFDNFSFPIPPLVEQAAIADYLDNKTAKIDCIIAKKEQQLELIKEHRKSLIYEYVTGKKRVKEYQQDGN